MGVPMGGNGAFNAFTRPSVGVLMRRVFYLTALFVCETIVFGVLCTLNSDMAILQHDNRSSLPNCKWTFLFLSNPVNSGLLFFVLIGVFFLFCSATWNSDR